MRSIQVFAVVFVTTTTSLSCGEESSSPRGASPSNEPAPARTAGPAAPAPQPSTSGNTADGAAPPAGPVVRFAALGDTGKGNTGQYDVARGIKTKCEKDGCDLVYLLGDNIYDSGVTSTSDAQWQEKFERPYANVNAPFYAVLGNHDYGGGGRGTDFDRGAFQVAYTNVSTKWKMPSAYYRHTLQHVEFFATDTNMQFWGRADDQKRDFPSWIAASTATWKIGVGHHPYKSNGPHGNAGSYDNVPFVPIANGKAIKEFDEQVLCGKVDVILKAHDHSRQWLTETCSGSELIVSGGGASPSELPGKQPNHFQTLALGFVYFRIEGKSMRVEFVDKNGETEFTRTITKP